MISFGNPEILSMSRCSSPFLQTRLELFEKQVEITGGYRGNANVQYAWIASSEQGINKILMYGLGHCGPSALRSAFGVGVHMTSASYAYTRFVFHFCREKSSSSYSLIIY